MTLIANQTLGHSQARQNFSSNFDAVGRTQPELRQWIADQLLNVEWVFGTDRFLTAVDEFGQWWSGCSLPRQAARNVLGRLEINGAVGCYLLPSHAAHLATALERLRPEQAIVAVILEHRDLAFLLHCHDFSEEIRTHRLWFAAGAAWDVDLRNLFESRPGLATPSLFIRTPDADAQQVQDLIITAQQIFTEISNLRTSQLQSSIDVTDNPKPSRPRLCIVAPSRFRLWNDLSPAMLSGIDQNNAIDVVHFDADDPLCSSPLALTAAVQSCSTIFTANTGRGDLPGLVPECVPWITWITTARFPTSALASPLDHLLVVDPRLVEPAIRAGWSAARVKVATWPAASSSTLNTPNGAPLGIIADTSSLDTPADLIEYSSHSILWESIRNELLNNPLALGQNIRDFLRDRMKRARVAEDAFPAARFVEKLIFPAYQQGIARTLLRANFPLRIFGKGWSSIAEFASRASGEIATRQQLHEITQQHSALVHMSPTPWLHPIEFCGVPVVRPGAGGKEALLRQARKALEGGLPVPSFTQPTLGPQVLTEIMRSTCKSLSDRIG